MFDFTVTLQSMDGTAIGEFSMAHSQEQLLHDEAIHQSHLDATLMVSTMDGVVMIISTGQSPLVEIGSPAMAFITIEDSCTYVHSDQVHIRITKCCSVYVCGVCALPAYASVCM